MWIWLIQIWSKASEVACWGFIMQMPAWSRCQRVGITECPGWTPISFEKCIPLSQSLQTWTTRLKSAAIVQVVHSSSQHIQVRLTHCPKRIGFWKMESKIRDLEGWKQSSQSSLSHYLALKCNSILRQCDGAACLRMHLASSVLSIGFSQAYYSSQSCAQIFACNGLKTLQDCFQAILKLRRRRGGTLCVIVLKNLVPLNHKSKHQV